MTVNVYKSDFSVFEGLYNAVIYHKSGIKRGCKNFLEVDFGYPHMNPYGIIARYHAETERVSYRHLMELRHRRDIDFQLLAEVFYLLDEYTHTTDQIAKRIDNALAYPVGHVRRTVL